MRKPDLPYLEFKTVKGRKYNYFRLARDGRVHRHRLPDNPDSQEFSEAYWAIRSGRKKALPKTTWHKLVTEFYKTPGYGKKAEGTKANYRRHCEAIREKNGEKDVRSFRRKDALAVQRAMQDTWSKANERIAVLSILCKLAVVNAGSKLPRLAG